jgi:hypothetical protein
MKTRKKTPAALQIGHDPDPVSAALQMQELLRALNNTRTKTFHSGKPDIIFAGRLPLSDMQVELRSLVEKWKASGPNLQVMFAEDPELRRRTRHGTTLLYPGTDGKGYLEWSAVTPDAHLLSTKADFRPPQDKALRYFMNLITNPDWVLLGGPCGRCGDYFLKKTNRKRVYCSKKCGSTATAVPFIQRKRQQEKADKIRLAQTSIGKWQEAKRRMEWKRWVTIETRLTARWLTRAVNEGFIQPPKSFQKNLVLEKADDLIE